MHFTTSFFLGFPLALALPSSFATRDGGSCDAQPVFNLDNIRYSSTILYSTPAHLAISRATIDFNVTNKVADAQYKNSCSGASSGQQWSGAFFAFPSQTPCGVVEVGAQTNFSFVLGTKTVQVNETWSCGGHNYLGVATQSIDLDCETKKYQNPNWSQGQTYSEETVTCKPLNARLVPTVTKLD